MLRFHNTLSAKENPCRSTETSNLLDLREKPPDWRSACRLQRRVDASNPFERTPLNTTDRIKLFGHEIDVVNMSQAVDRVMGWVREDGPCRYVVTPNLDHMVMLQSSHPLCAAYDDADLVIADGWPLVMAAKVLGKPLPERVAGSDLVPAVFASADESRKLRVFLLGAAEGVAERAASMIHDRWPNVEVVDTYSPPLGFEKKDSENFRILRRIAAVTPDVVVVGLGAPKQENWVHKHRKLIKAKAVLCAGATIDFLAGEQKRAPRWVQAVYCEWLYRLLNEPGRLWKRYFHDALVFPQLMAQEWARGIK